MIIWIASYPKSGNTWLRAIIASLVYSDDGIFSFEKLKKIRQFPEKQYFKDLVKNFKDFDEIKKNWITAQDKINLDEKIKFFKTHQGNFKIGNDHFTNNQNTQAVIYIVRDPRNVVTSFANHSSVSVDESTNSIINEWVLGGNLNSFNYTEKTTLYSGTWASNYKSWKSFKSQGKYLLIKYEDLINKKEEILLKMLKFIYKLNKKKLDVDQVKFKNVIESTSFERMKNLEKDAGFFESKINKKTGKKISFFNLGKKNDWKKLIDPTIKKKIENAFKEEMEELGYL